MRKISLSKNASGEYVYCMRLIDPATGRQVRYSGNTHLTNKRDAEQFAWDRIQPILQARTVEECLALRMRVLSGMKSVRIRDAHLLAKRVWSNAGSKVLLDTDARWRKFYGWIKSNHPRAEMMSDVTPTMAQEFIDSLDNVSPTTVHIYASTINRVFKALESDAGIYIQPFENLILPKRKPHGRRAFTIEQVNAIFAGDKCMSRTLFIIGIMTGLRLKDACLLSSESIDLKGNVIALKTAKTGAYVRIPILNPLRITLKSMDLREKFALPDASKKYLKDPSAVCRKNAAYLTACGIETNEVIDGRSVPIYGFHSCRHTFAYLAGIARIPQPIVQAILGHMSPQMTELYQRHVRDEDAQKALASLADILGG